MNIHDPNVTLLKVTTGALPASRKVYSQPEAAPELRVPLREIALDASSGEPPLPVYDTTGPYTDPAVTIDVEKGLGRARIEWVKERGGVEQYEGRPIQPVDNGNVTGKHLARNQSNRQHTGCRQVSLERDVFPLRMPANRAGHSSAGRSRG